MHSRRGPGICRIIAISTNCLNARKLRLYLRSDVPPDAVGINQQHAGAGDALPLFITVSPFAGGGDLITLSIFLPCFVFSLLFPGWIPEAVCGSRCQSRVDARHSGRTHLILSLLVLALIAGSTHIEMIAIRWQRAGTRR